MQLAEVREPAPQVPNASGASVLVNECGHTVVLHCEIEEHIEEQSASDVVNNVDVSLAVADVGVRNGDQRVISNVSGCAQAACASADGPRPFNSGPAVSCCAPAGDSEDSSNGYDLSLSPTAVDVAAALAVEECRSNGKEDRLCSPGSELGGVDPTLPLPPSPESTAHDVVNHIPLRSQKSGNIGCGDTPGPRDFKFSASTVSSPSPPAAGLGHGRIVVAATSPAVTSSSSIGGSVSTSAAAIEAVRQVAPLVAERASRLLAESGRRSGSICGSKAAAGALLMAAAAAGTSGTSDTSEVNRQANASLPTSSNRPSFQQRAALTDIPSRASPGAVARPVAPRQGAMSLLATRAQSSFSSFGGAVKVIDSAVACGVQPPGPPDVSRVVAVALKGCAAGEKANSDAAEAGRNAGTTVSDDHCAAVAVCAAVAARARERCSPKVSTGKAAAETPNGPKAVPSAAAPTAGALSLVQFTSCSPHSTVSGGGVDFSSGNTCFYSIRPVLVVPTTAFLTVPGPARQPVPTTLLRDSGGSERRPFAAIRSLLSPAVSPQHQEAGSRGVRVHGPAARPEPPREGVSVRGPAPRTEPPRESVSVHGPAARPEPREGLSVRGPAPRTAPPRESVIVHGPAARPEPPRESVSVHDPAARPEPPREGVSVHGLAALRAPPRKVESCASQSAPGHPGSPLEAQSGGSLLQRLMRPVPPVRTASRGIARVPTLPEPPTPPATESRRSGVPALNAASSSDPVLSTQGADSRKRKLPAANPSKQGSDDRKCICCGLRFCPRKPFRDFCKY